jgi:hypothetical protein
MRIQYKDLKLMECEDWVQLAQDRLLRKRYNNILVPIKRAENVRIKQLSDCQLFKKGFDVG